MAAALDKIDDCINKLIKERISMRFAADKEDVSVIFIYVAGGIY